MIADDIKITINFHQTTPDGACIHKKCTVTNYKNKKEMFGRGQTEVSGESRDHSTAGSPTAPCMQYFCQIM